ncbi:type VII secretion system-associated protein [Streptomyces sp. SID13666]|uniref:type VII secretion system-associated protein n=1 Tax=unclassified Streptomyces TaxID=2593676 RepID=UPI0013C126F4|nr:type VII secretion system-associated protein [Streptomyces sp. SID13666]NEA71519.1 type VII secretion system-associated protein [Streptomyces sp. SID13588]
MAEAVNLTHFDGASLKTFLQDHLMPFANDLKAIQDDTTDGIASMPHMAERLADTKAVHLSPPLNIGYMGNDGGGIVGHALIANTVAVAKSVGDVMTSHEKLFRDINKDLLATINKYLKAQGDNLDSIDGQKFLEGMKDVDLDLAPKGQPPTVPPTVPPPVTKP